VLGNVTDKVSTCSSLPEPAQHSQGGGKRRCKKDERIGRRREETAKKERIGAE
jgi:hypothetical protein